MSHALEAGAQLMELAPEALDRVAGGHDCPPDGPIFPNGGTDPPPRR